VTFVFMAQEVVGAWLGEFYSKTRAGLVWH